MLSRTSLLHIRRAGGVLEKVWDTLWETLWETLWDTLWDTTSLLILWETQ